MIDWVERNLLLLKAKASMNSLDSSLPIASSAVNSEEKVGMTRLEPVTFCIQNKDATKLRHIPFNWSTVSL
ncbi:hypothetical protein V6N11_014002 [Hibiscus sabdariffa]|uniref:Uncharacterized protein n=1 Tax=Hibiscus sabdariffa TaxID=183260 RepID=A0ABR2AFF3_9ROSI